MKKMPIIKNDLLSDFKKEQIESRKLNYLKGGDGDGDGDQTGDGPWIP